MYTYLYMCLYKYILECPGPTGLLFLWWPSANRGLQLPLGDLPPID